MPTHNPQASRPRENHSVPPSGGSTGLGDSEETAASMHELDGFADAVLAALPDPVFVLDESNALVWSNEPLQSVLGDSARALRGQTPPALFADSDTAAVRQALTAARAGDAPAPAEVTLLPRGDAPRPCTLTVRPLPADAGAAGHVVGTARTAPRPAPPDTSLRRERDRLAALYSGLPSPVVHYRVQDGDAIAEGINAAFADTFGASRDDVAGRNLDTLIASDEQRTQAEALTRQAVEEGSVQAEVIRTTKDGPRHFQLDSVLFSGGETPEGFAIYTDVTEQKEREQTLREEQDALRSMYRITADRTASFEDKVQRLIDLGREYLSLPYGFVTEITEGTQRILWASGEHTLLQSGASCPLSKSYCRKTMQEESLLAVQDAAAAGWTGDPAYEEFDLGTYIGSQILVDGDLYGTFCFAASEPRATSFTERERTFVELMTRWVSYELEHRRATEQLERQNERLDNFAGLVAHDLRNPLNVAKGRLELVEDTEDLSHLSSIDRALTRMDEIIEDLLAVTWAGQNLGEADLEPCDLAALGTSCWAQVDTSQARLVVDTAPCIYADETRLQRLLENLFRNAIEHAGDDVTLRVGRLDDGFFVEDDGPGIPPEQREKVLKAGYSSDEEGTGLGLSIVKTIADAHGWSLSLAEGREGGARFEVTGVDVATD